MLKILVVDGDEAVRGFFSNFFTGQQYDCFLAAAPLEALAVIREESPEVIIVDFALPSIGGIAFIKQVRMIDPSVKFVIIGAKTYDDYPLNETERLGIIEFAPKPVSLSYLRDHIFSKIQELQFLIEEEMGDKIAGMEISFPEIAINALESKDKYTEGHSKRVMSFCMNTIPFIPDHVRVKINTADAMRAALLHDIGKVSISESILNKPGRLTEEEFEILKKHPEDSGRILEPLADDMPVVIKAIKHHHERFDGYGYPDGLKGENIPLISRLIAVADTYDAITSDRAYRGKNDSKKAIEELINCRGTQLDPVMVHSFLRSIM